MKKARRSASLASAALRHEAQGELRQAIDAWTELNRRQRDGEVEQRLVRLRHEAARLPRRSAPPGPWPRPAADPFPSVAGKPPEVGREEFTAKILSGAICHHGCLLVRGLLPRGTAADLVLAMDAAFEAREAAMRGSVVRPWFVPDDEFKTTGEKTRIARGFSRSLHAVHACDSPPVLFSMLGALDAAGVPQVIGEHFGESPVLTSDKTMLRRIQPEPMPQPGWHQDGFFMGPVRSVDVWVALTRCGAETDSPGLEILPRRVGGVLECGGPAARNPIEIADGDVARAGLGVRSFIPRFEPGDALMFDDLFLHRTQPGGTCPRYALESWFFAASSHPEKYSPLAL